jgi:hypothetical protein
MPFYPTVRDAVAELVYGAPVNQIQLAGSAQVLLRLPDHRVRIHQATLGDGLVRVPVEEGRPAGARGCLLRAAWRPTPTSAQWCRQDVPITSTGEVEIETGDVPVEMWMILTAPDGQLLDRYGWSDTSVLQPEQTGDLAARVERWIQDGEGQQIEFKQELDADTAKVRFARTVAAFSNGDGGGSLWGSRMTEKLSAGTGRRWPIGSRISCENT